MINQLYQIGERATLRIVYTVVGQGKNTSSLFPFEFVHCPAVPAAHN